MNAVALGTELAWRRRRAGLSQADLAARIGTTQPAISKIESGRTLPTLIVLERLAVALDEPIEELVKAGTISSLSRRDRRERVRGVLGPFRFNPWDRNPSAAEAESLRADALTRERFEPEEAQ
jgi:transcriptional regulator with XRE-family HTH domain